VKIRRAAPRWHRSRLPAALGMALAALLSASARKPQMYQNDEFGISVPVPKGTLLCPVREDQHDHGPLFLLGAADIRRCDDSGSSRPIVVFSGYNAADATKILYDFLKSECDGPCLPPPPNLGIRGLRTASARVNHSDGWVDIIVVTQAGKPDALYDPAVPSINYDLRLHTKPENLNEALRVFRTVLQTIRLGAKSNSAL